MNTQIITLKKTALESLKGISSERDLELWKNEYLGKKGKAIELLKGIKDMSLDEKREFGLAANQLREELETAFEKQRKEILAAQDAQSATKEWMDLTVPGKKHGRGTIHPLTQLTYEIEDIFTSMGFEVADGPEIEDDYHNFTALNIPETHPARDMHDTLWLSDIKKLLRTHTSPVQVRYMESHKPPIRIICPGRVFRKDDLDATHSPTFQQCEGLMISENISMTDLKGILTVALKKLIRDPNLKVRFRSSYFPFVEPGVEVDVHCTLGGKTRWIELLGAGMVHPNVLKHVGYDPEKVQGFAFGCGLERIAMVRHKIDDIRLFYENDPRFLKQF